MFSKTGLQLEILTSLLECDNVCLSVQMIAWFFALGLRTTYNEPFACVKIYLPFLCTYKQHKITYMINHDNWQQIPLFTAIFFARLLIFFHFFPAK